MKKVIRKSETLQSQVYEYLREQIISGGIIPGQRLIEEKIAEETGVSRSPIREAIRRLEIEGFVVSNTHSQGGVTVYKPSIDDFIYLYECRQGLEPNAAMFAALRRADSHLMEMKETLDEMKEIADEVGEIKIYNINTNFHQIIIEASQNPYLVKIMKQLQSLIIFNRNAILQVDPKRPKTD
jgi:DNA-binding GntR family transcriptional regulator